MKRYLLIVATTALLSGCCLAPNSVRPELEHVSHVTQHFGDHTTNMGYEAINVVARWNTRNAYLDIGEGFNVSPDSMQCPGGLCGPREMFTARVGYIFDIRSPQ